ncbi:MAG: exopolysaccharide Pel transporter PelG [Lachnospiraceae bacterium]|nr:exopolysaccharide Pel transporter PelG [Lachnospiraceae bacterium]
MAGIGVKLNKLYSKKTMLTSLIGVGYSAVITIVPMFLVIITVMLMEPLLGVSKLNYAVRELYTCTVLYIFIFGLLASAPFSAVLSKYLSDVIYEETYQDILPCYYVGLLINVIFSSLIGIPFCVWQYIEGGISIEFIFAGYCGFIIMVIVFYSMLYLSICKSFGKITWFYLVGMLVTLAVSVVFVYVLHLETTISMLISLDIGFLLIASLELAQIKSYFRYNSRKYKAVLKYLGKYWQLIGTNFLYMLGVYMHNFVFWSTDMQMVVSNCFYCAPDYDMASCLGMLTSASATIIFISRVEMKFHVTYKGYSEAVIGGRGMDIDSAKRRMFRQMATELTHLVQIQFAISVLIYFVFTIVLPRFGFGGLGLQIYPGLAIGYFIWFIMNAALIFQYYFGDLNGALLSSFSFCVTTFFASKLATMLEPKWYGLGLIVGSFVGWTVAYYRLHRIEKTLDVHIFCNGHIMKKGHGTCPANKVFDRYALLEEQGKKRKKKRKKKVATT